MKVGLLIAVALAIGVFTLACEGSTDVFEERGWRSLGPARQLGAEQVRVMLALWMKDGAEEQLSEIVRRVSDPDSATYGQYLSREQLAEVVAPPQAHIDAAVAFVKSLGGVDIELLASGEYVAATLPLAAAERAFQVDVHAWAHHTAPSPRLAATTVPTVPAELASVVQLVSGLRELPLSLQQQRKAPAPSAADAPGTPQVTLVTGSQSKVYISVTPTCSDGSTTSMPQGMLCADHPPTLLGFRVITASTDGSSFEEVFVSDSSNSTNLPGVSLTCVTSAKAATTCTIAVPERAYRLITVDVAASFTPGSFGPSNNFYGTSVATAPFVTPQMLRALYNIPVGAANPPAASSNRQAIASFSEQYWSSADLTQFGRQLGVPVQPVTTLGFNDFNRPGDEAQLDITWIVAMGVQVPTSFFSTTGGYLLEWAAKVLDQTGDNFPLVNSISYSQNENSLTGTHGTGWAERVDLDFQKIAARGGSVIVAAGDAGATNVGHGTTTCAAFVPQYPASSAFVTSVGATGMSPAAQPLCGAVDPMYGAMPCSDPVREVAVDASNGFVWTTGGGVSNRTDRPTWQTDAVSAYLASAQAQGVLPPANLWNANGRVYPDITAVGSNLIIVRNGVVEIAAGTSASTPITAGIMATLNGLLLAQGKPPLGFINPLLYKTLANWPAAFNDVVVGTNRCGDVLHPPNVRCCPYGWPALVGYDAISGVGSVNFEQFAYYALKQ